MITNRSTFKSTTVELFRKGKGNAMQTTEEIIGHAGVLALHKVAEGVAESFPPGETFPRYVWIQTVALASLVVILSPCSDDPDEETGQAGAYAALEALTDILEVDRNLPDAMTPGVFIALVHACAQTIETELQQIREFKESRDGGTT